MCPSTRGVFHPLTYNLCSLHMLVPPLHPGKHCHFLISAGHSPGSHVSLLVEPFHSHMWLFHITPACCALQCACRLPLMWQLPPCSQDVGLPQPASVSISRTCPWLSFLPWHGNRDGKWGIGNLNAVCLACYVPLICLHESDGVFHSWVLIEA